MKIFKCEEIIKDKEVSISGSKRLSLIKSIRDCGGEHINFFSSRVKEVNLEDVRLSDNELEVTNTTADICLLDGKSINLLVARMPKSPNYSLVRIGFNPYWIPAFAGLIRRIFKRYLKIEGFIFLDKSLWLVLKKTIPPLYKQISFFIPSSNIQTFLDWTKENNIQYCIPRFYEELPNIKRGNDIDIILDDSDKDRVVGFLQNIVSKLKGRDLSDVIKIDISLTRGGDVNGELPYYPPELAEKMIQNAVDGPANSKIPEPKDVFLSFIYHCLYHDRFGYKSGIKSNLPNARVEKNPRNDYTGVITKMAQELGIELSIDMESLDEYLAQEGWRPPLDTLAFIASYNLWVQHRFFDSNNKKDIGLGVMVFREKAVKKEGFLDKAVKMAERSNFAILAVKEFNKEEQEIMSKKLRGGNWGNDTLPAAAIVVLDKKPRKKKSYEIRFVKPNRVRKLKLKIRRFFDTGGESIIHATDTALEAEEYIEIAFSQEKEEIKRKIEELI